MTLKEIIPELEQLDRGLTIYAADPWHASTKALVARPLDDGRVPEEAVTAGCGYFLEVFVALGIVHHLSASAASEPTEDEKCAKLIEYAQWVSSDARSPQQTPFKWNFPVSMMIYCSACGKHFDIVIAGKGAGHYHCSVCGKVHEFDLEAFAQGAIEQSRKMRKRKHGHR
ncbi:MAG TPA: hypothetical protein VG754_01655 [Verrucomicrobiae bacterium]|nr:hypothetical protein [Verrucomicrobiae bacterium]